MVKSQYFNIRKHNKKVPLSELLEDPIIPFSELSNESKLFIKNGLREYDKKLIENAYVKAQDKLDELLEKTIQFKSRFDYDIDRKIRRVKISWIMDEIDSLKYIDVISKKIKEGMLLERIPEYYSIKVEEVYPDLSKFNLKIEEHWDTIENSDLVSELQNVVVEKVTKVPIPKKDYSKYATEVVVTNTDSPLLKKDKNGEYVFKVKSSESIRLNTPKPSTYFCPYNTKVKVPKSIKGTIWCYEGEVFNNYIIKGKPLSKKESKIKENIKNRIRKEVIIIN